MTPYQRTLGRLSRRDLFRVAAAFGAAAVAPATVPATVTAAPRFSADPFALGVASGDPLPSSVVLWTRLAPDPLNGGGMPAGHVQARWEVAADEAFRTIVRSGTAIARADLAHSVHVDAAGLRPARDYWYRFHAGRATSPIGRTRTAPARGAAVTRFRFAICGCNHYEDGYFTAFRRIAEQGFDVVLHTGDYIYESAAGTRGRRVRDHRGAEPMSLTDYRNRYAQYKLDADLRAAHHSAPFLVIPDDHEVSNNYAGDIDEHDSPQPLFRLRRAAAYQAYYEHMPLRATARPYGSHMRIYRRLHFGTLIDLHLLDTRQWRSDQPCGDGLRSNCAAALAPTQTMLGAVQEQWLFRNLARDHARWTVLGQQVPTFALDRARANPDGRFAMDKWDGYVAARQRLYGRLIATQAPNPIVISGDVHTHFAADLKRDFTDRASPVLGAELTNSSITSGGDGSTVSPYWTAVKADNPHVKYNSNRRGYIACTATPAAVRAEFMVLDRVSTPDEPATVGGTVVIEAGHPGAQLA